MSTEVAQSVVVVRRALEDELRSGGISLAKAGLALDILDEVATRLEMPRSKIEEILRKQYAEWLRPAVESELKKGSEIENLDLDDHKGESHNVIVDVANHLGIPQRRLKAWINEWQSHDG